MFLEMFGNSSVVRLEGLLKNRYGMGLRLASIADAHDVEVQQSKGEVRGGALYVTIRARGKYLATAIMSGAQSLTSDDVTSVTEMVQLVLEPALYSSFLKQKEKQVAIEDHAEHSNVIELFELPRESAGQTHQGPEFLSSMLLLESVNPQTIQRVSVHIHELSERWALLNFNDVRAQLESVQDLRELGAMTLVVSNLESLSETEQRLLTDFSLASNSMSEPLILIGSTRSFRELSQEPKLLPDLVSQMRRNRLELDRFPKEFARLQEALELFLDRNAMLI